MKFSVKVKNIMAIKTISFSLLESELQKTLTECAATGEMVVVRMPDDRLVSIQSLEPDAEDDDLVNELIETNPKFRALIEKSKASPRRPLFPR